MKVDDALEADENSALERQFQAELPKIVIASDNDLEAAVAAIEHYLDQAPSRELRKSLLTWKGRFYLEHGRHDDAARELRAADEIKLPDDLKNLNTKRDLADALERGGDPRQAYAVLTAALDEIDAPDLLLDVLQALVRLTSSRGQAMPPGADAALSRAKQFYGIDPSHAAGDLPAETERVAELVRDASVRFTRLQHSLAQAEGPAERVALVKEYLACITVPCFKQRAEDLLRGGQATPIP
jgi:tetratricopeptide (TPR) repeat protein